MKEIIIGSNEEQKRLDKLLIKYLDKAPSSFIYKMLRKKNITLNDKKASGNEKLNSGDIIKIFLSDETFAKFSSLPNTKKEYDFMTQKVKNMSLKLKVIYEDDNFILMNKPYGVLSQKAEANDISINEMMLAYLYNKGCITNETLKTFKPSICNRLDRNTSGLIIGGKSLKALQYSSEFLKDRSAEKYYLAFVHGNIFRSALIKGYLTKDRETNKVKITNNPVNPEDNPIETFYMPIALYENMTLLKIKLITGKPHQIRAHLASINHPIIGDSKYGNASVNKYFYDIYGIRHQLLHSYEFIFPDKDEDFKYLANKQFIAKPPEAFNIMLKNNIPLKGLDENGNMEFQRIKGQCS